MEISFSLEEINIIAKQILIAFPKNRHFAFYADMGSGKTTLIRALCYALDVEDNVTSPTYSIINEYCIQNTNRSVFHMDWYRLKHTEDAIEAGVQDILLDEDAYCFIEWPEIAPELLPKDTLAIKINTINDTKRTIIIQ